MIAVLLPLLVQVLAAMPQAISAVKDIWTLATATTAPTDAEQAQYDAALDAAHQALQAS